MNTSSALFYQIHASSHIVTVNRFMDCGFVTPHYKILSYTYTFPHSPTKMLLLATMQISKYWCNCWKHCWKTFAARYRMASTMAVTISSADWNWHPHSFSFKWRNKNKLCGLRSGKYGGTAERWSDISTEQLAGRLSCSDSLFFLHQSSGFLRQTELQWRRRICL
jgi:hypothetical protein